MNDARTYLQRLAEELTERQWTANLGRASGEPVLKVVNPAAPELGESVVCRGSDGDYTFCWSWSQTIGPVAGVTGVADRIQHVLRGVGS